MSKAAVMHDAKAIRRQVLYLETTCLWVRCARYRGGSGRRAGVSQPLSREGEGGLSVQLYPDRGSGCCARMWCNVVSGPILARRYEDLYLSYEDLYVL
jgi:hypothetical protein